MQNNPFIKYWTLLTFFSLAVCFITLFLWVAVPIDYIHSVPYYVAMYYVVTLGCYALVYFSKMKFEKVFLISKAIKFFIYIAVFAVVLLADLEKNSKFAFAYLILFLIYSVYDTVSLHKLVKRRNNAKNNE